MIKRNERNFNKILFHSYENGNWYDCLGEKNKGNFHWLFLIVDTFNWARISDQKRVVLYNKTIIPEARILVHDLKMYAEITLNRQNQYGQSEYLSHFTYTKCFNTITDNRQHRNGMHKSNTRIWNKKLAQFLEYYWNWHLDIHHCKHRK